MPLSGLDRSMMSQSARMTLFWSLARPFPLIAENTRRGWLSLAISSPHTSRIHNVRILRRFEAVQSIGPSGPRVSELGPSHSRSIDAHRTPQFPTALVEELVSANTSRTLSLPTEPRCTSPDGVLRNSKRRSKSSRRRIMADRYMRYN